MDYVDPDYTIMIIVIGSNACGKSWVIDRFIDSECKPTGLPGGGLSSKIVEVGGKKVKLIIWYLGQQEFLILVGSKIDLLSCKERDDAELKARRFCEENGLTFVLTSAVTCEGIEDAFLRCARNILAKIENALW
eukprot:m51a1_g3713 hypothetical protein (134) ;mRNA; r:448583-449744